MIIDVNNIVRKALTDGASVPSLAEHWDFLQVQAALYINSELPGLPSAYQSGSKPLRGFVQRLKGKQGRFRGNLSGKRVDFSARTVISPDPNLAPGEVGIPRCVATTLTYPERVTRHNVAALRARVLNGMGAWPGANFVAFPDGGRWFLKYGDRARIAAELAPGDVVERHLADGDVVLFNRQPSLHRLSVMAHRVRVVPGRTFRFNECVCAPYNADFDGDEMNVHVPQTEAARAEARELMGVERNLRTPKNGDLVVAATQDFLTVAWLLTGRDTWLTRAQVGQLAAAATCGAAQFDPPPPAILKPVELWSGKQLFTVLVRPSAGDGALVCLQTAEKGHVASAGPACPNDAYVLFVDSDLLLGRLGKATLGAGGARGLFQSLAADAGAPAAAAAMHRLARLAARWVGDAGLSIGIDDVTPAPGLEAAKRAALAEAHARADALAPLGAARLARPGGRSWWHR
jgi:DNA-directed RNA polymerase III subunit RPC1